MFFHSCNGTNIFIWWKMKCSIQLGFALLNGTFHLSPHENICTIALINIHYLYIHTLRVHYAHAAANLNSGYSKYAKVAHVHYFCTIALRTSRAVLTRA